MLSIVAAYSSSRSRAKRTHHGTKSKTGPWERAGARVKSHTYLLMGKAQLVLENSLAIDQILHLVCKSTERLDERLGEVLVIHPICRRGWIEPLGLRL